MDGELAPPVPDMRRPEVTRREGDRIEAVARSRFGMRAHIRGVRRPGHTLVAFAGGVQVPGRAALIPIGVSTAGQRVLARLHARVGG